MLQGVDLMERGRHGKPNAASSTQLNSLACCCRVLT